MFKRHILLRQIQELHNSTVLPRYQSLELTPGSAHCPRPVPWWKLLCRKCWEMPQRGLSPFCLRGALTLRLMLSILTPSYTAAAPQPSLCLSSCPIDLHPSLQTWLRLITSVFPGDLDQAEPHGHSWVCPAWFAACAGLPGHLPLHSSQPSPLSWDTLKNTLPLLTLGLWILWLHSSSSDCSPQQPKPNQLQYPANVLPHILATERNGSSKRACSSRRTTFLRVEIQWGDNVSPPAPSRALNLLKENS